MKMRKRLFAVAMALCMVLALALLVGCGSSDKAGAADSGEASTAAGEQAEEQAKEEPADPAEKFVGDWKMAAVKSEGITMSGNLSELLEKNEDATLGALTLEAGGTGKMDLGDDSAKLKWELVSDDEISMKPEKKSETLDKDVKVKYKDESLSMRFEQDGKKADAIFTKDGKYADAREISMKAGKDITSEEELIGKWKMTGLNMAGISAYGSAKDLEKMSGGTDMSVTFEEGGTLKMSSSEGTWKVDKKGATMTTQGFDGEVTCPVKKMTDEEIVIDMSKIFGGTTFIALMERAK